MIEWNQVEFSRATTLTGSKSVVGTIDISANRKTTIYTDLTNTTGYAFYRFKNSALTTYTDYSGGVSYSGNGLNSVQQIVEDACGLASVELNEKASDEEDLVHDANEAQKYVAEMQDWTFELLKDDTSLSTTENENRYALSALTYEMKYPGTFQGILDVRFGPEPLRYVSPDEMDDLLKGTVQSTLSGAVTAGATSVVLADTHEFTSVGAVSIGSNNGVSYAANDKSTGTLSGISASAITANVADGSSAWQGINPGKPTKYTIFDGYIVLNVPVKTTEAGKKLKIKYLRKIPTLTDFSSATVIPFYDCLKYYVASKIFSRKQTSDDAKDKMQTFIDKVTSNSQVYLLPAMEEQEYYTFASQRTLGSYYDDVTTRFNN